LLSAPDSENLKNPGGTPYVMSFVVYPANTAARLFSAVTDDESANLEFVSIFSSSKRVRLSPDGLLMFL
jgi:hypothetical protein